MTCCICYEHAKKRLDCGHVVCRKCTLDYINTLWKQGDTDLKCPMCREKLGLKCIISNGTPIFKYCIDNGHLPTDYNPDRFQWTKANLVNTPVPPGELESIRCFKDVA